MILNIAEWIANLFILGIAVIIWMVVIFLGMLLCLMIAEKLKKLIK